MCIHSAKDAEAYIAYYAETYGNEQKAKAKVLRDIEDQGRFDGEGVSRKSSEIKAERLNLIAKLKADIEGVVAPAEKELVPA